MRTVLLDILNENFTTFHSITNSLINIFSITTIITLLNTQKTIHLIIKIEFIYSILLFKIGLFSNSVNSWAFSYFISLVVCETATIFLLLLNSRYQNKISKIF